MFWPGFWEEFWAEKQQKQIAYPDCHLCKGEIDEGLLYLDTADSMNTPTRRFHLDCVRRKISFVNKFYSVGRFYIASKRERFYGTGTICSDDL